MVCCRTYKSAWSVGEKSVPLRQIFVSDIDSTSGDRPSPSDIPQGIKKTPSAHIQGRFQLHYGQVQHGLPVGNTGSLRAERRCSHVRTKIEKVKWHHPLCLCQKKREVCLSKEGKMPMLQCEAQMSRRAFRGGCDLPFLSSITTAAGQTATTAIVRGWGCGVILWIIIVRNDGIVGCHVHSLRLLVQCKLFGELHTDG